MRAATISRVGLHDDGRCDGASRTIASMTDLTIRPITDEEYPAFVKAFMDGFAEDIPADDFPSYIRTNLPPELTLAAFDGDDIVGTFGGLDLTLTVPGGAQVPMEGTTVVTVFPTHRRMGLMKRMMHMHLDNAVEAGKPLAGLWASESGIYERFGYGIATYCDAIKMDGRKVAFRDEIEVDRVRRIPVEGASEILGPIYDERQRETPGMWARSDGWWYDILADLDWMKNGRTKLRIVVHDGPDGPDGYALYRQKGGDSDDWHDNGTVHVLEVIANTPRATASLWSYLTNIDLSPNVKYNNFPVDDDLGPMLKEGRRIQRVFKHEALYVRILDVIAALEARTYQHDGEILIGLKDSFRPHTAGTYRLTSEGGVGRCAEVDETPDVTMDVEVLGAIYLGGPGAFGYAAASRIQGAPEAIDRLNRLFRTAREPWCNWVF